MSKRGRSFLETGIARGGMKNCARGLAWSSMWTITRLDFGREPTFNEVREWWALSNAQAFRYQQSYRRCWPQYKGFGWSPWVMTQCALDQGLVTERRLRWQLRAFKTFKGVGCTELQRDAMLDQFAQLVGVAAVAA